MQKIGLALSGGGFRASLYHLGLVRFLRDAGVLSQVSHITSVSGGSIFAAHLVLNWDRYNGSPNEFDAAASEILAFVRLGVRNRITRRFPLAMPLRGPRRLLGFSNRKLTLTGLLEYHYEKYLYGDASLFQLPESPQLHILATNLSEGCLCSFNRNGLLMVRRQPGNTFRIDRIHAGLATVPMAVTASSAFPGFFPPLELTGAEVGAGGDFGRQAYTDGGVYDNLGVRMFGCLARSLLADNPLSADDFVDFKDFVAALREAGQAAEETPLRRLVQVLAAARSRPEPILLGNGTASSNLLPPPPGAGRGDGEEWLAAGLWDLLRLSQLHHEPLFAGLTPVDPDAETLLHASRVGGRGLNADDQHWLNRHLLEAAFRQATGHACFRRLDSGLDAVLVSDVGKRIAVQGQRRAGGLIRTTLRATDILMDRVWQLENETFRDTPGFVFAPITEVVEPAEDSTALHPEIQRQAANIRTDVDRFSMLEISSLVRHGYCVGRKVCRTRPDLFGDALPAEAPWDPVPGPRGAAVSASAPGRLGGPDRRPAITTVEARALQGSSVRRIWSTLLDYRDWSSHVYVPILIPLFVLLPFFVVKAYQRSQRINHLVESLSQGSRDLEKMTSLLDGASELSWTGVTADEVPKLDEPSFKGFEVLQDSRILDMRRWKPSEAAKDGPTSLIYNYRRLKVLKLAENDGNNNFRIKILQTSPIAQVRFPQTEGQLAPKLRVSIVEDPVLRRKEYHREVSFDFQKVPAGDSVDLYMEALSSAQFVEGGENANGFSWDIQVETAELTTWILMPEGNQYRSWRLLRHKTGKPETTETADVVTEFMADDNSLLAFKLLSLKPGYTYELQWFYK